jgi:mannose-6-phosphate isomerase-like protein (cupin superfamily)
VPEYTLRNLREDVDDAAQRFGVEGLEARFARGALELQECGLTYFRVGPGVRPPWGHTHSEQEEVYLLVSGSGRVKLDDEVIDLKAWDAIRIPAGVMRAFEGGEDGAEIVAFGAPNTENKDIEMVQGWWTD